MKIESYLSELDTKYFGFNIAKINNFDVSPADIVKFLKEKKVKLIISKIPANEIDLINTLEELNFVIKDVQATYKFDLKNYIPNYPWRKTNFNIRDAEVKDLPQLEDLAMKSFANYGHYAADKKLIDFNVGEIYADWIKRSYENKNVADKIYIAEFDDKIAGFLSFKTFSQNDKYSAGGLGAVSIDYRNNNVFKMLSTAGLNWGKEQDQIWQEHNVLITNYPVNRSFSKMGFNIYKTFITMHCWI